MFRFRVLSYLVCIFSFVGSIGYLFIALKTAKSNAFETFDVGDTGKLIELSLLF